MQRFKKFIYYPFIHAWRELQGGHPFGMFRTCLEGFFKGSFFHVRPEKGRGVFQFFRNTTDKFAVLFRLALTHMPSFKREPVVGGGKQLTCSLAPSGVVHPLRGYRFTALSGGKSAMSNNLSHGTVIDSPKPTQIPVAPKFAEISEFHGITDIHAFNGFNSFYDFLRKTFFHTRYVLVTGKDTENVSMPVYNLSVNKDESYVLPIGIVHNCRCTVVQVRKDKYPLSDETQAMNLGSQATAGKHQEMFMYNPGKKMTTFPAYNAYTISRCKECPYSGGSIKLAKVPDNELCQACRILWEIRRQEQRNNYSKIVSGLKEKLIGKYSFTDEHFNGRSGVFVKNSITENLGYGNLFYAKADILNNIEQYLSSATEYKWEDNRKKEKKPNLKGCHVFSTKYNGKEKAFSDFKIDLKFEDFNDGRIIFHYIRFVDIEKGKKQNK